MKLQAEIAGQGVEPVVIEIGHIETTQPNLDFANAWDQAAAHADALAPNTAIPVADAITMQGVTVHIGQTTVTQDSARIEKLRVYPWALLHDGVPSLAQLQALPAPGPRPPTLEELLALLRGEAAVMLGLAYESYSARSMKVTGRYLTPRSPMRSPGPPGAASIAASCGVPPWKVSR